MPRNKLAPTARGTRWLNLALNLCWAVIWLGRWAIRLTRLGVRRIRSAWQKRR